MALANGAIPTSALTGLSVGGHLLAVPARAFEEWRRQAAAAGRTLTITSIADAYRALAVQERVFLQRYIPQATGGGIYGDVRWYRNVRYVRRHGAAAAVPGTSNHGRGLAVDIANAGPFGGPFHDWLLATGPALGWSNAEGRSVNEPWHWVHDGATLAGSSAGVSTGLAGGGTITLPTIAAPVEVPDVQEDDMFRIRVSAGITDAKQHGDVYLVRFGPTGQAMFKHLTPQQDSVCDIAGIPKTDVTQGMKDIIRLEVIQLEAAWKVN